MKLHHHRKSMFSKVCQLLEVKYSCHIATELSSGSFRLHRVLIAGVENVEPCFLMDLVE